MAQLSPIRLIALVAALLAVATAYWSAPDPAVAGEPAAVEAMSAPQAPSEGSPARADQGVEAADGWTVSPGGADAALRPAPSAWTAGTAAPLHAVKSRRPLRPPDA